MNELVIMKDQQAVTTSLKVARVFNKQHKHVLEAIDSIKKGLAENSATPLDGNNEGVQNWTDASDNQIFAEGTYVHPQNHQKYRIIYMNRKGFVLLAMGFTGKRAFEFKNKYIDAFDVMELQLQEQYNRKVLPQSPMETLKLMFQATEQTDKKVTKVEHRVTDLEDNQCLAPGEYNYISHRVRAAVSEYEATHHLLLTQKQRSKLYKDINTGLNQVTGIKTRTQLRKKDFDTADEYIRNWQPSTATLQIIKQLSGIAEGQMSLKNQQA